MSVLSISAPPVHDEPVGCYSELYFKYKDIVNQAIHKCPGVSPVKINRNFIWELAEIENKYKPPKSLRGMLLAAACQESKYNPKAKGDRRFSKKRRPKAIGLLQFWPWANKYINRLNPYQSAHFWMKRIKKQLKTSIPKQCKFKSRKRRWLAAWVTAIRFPKKSGRCYEKPKHYRLLKRWRRNIKKDRKP